MKQYYNVSEYYQINKNIYQLKATISDQTMNLQGALHKPNSSSWHNVVRLEIPYPYKQESKELDEFMSLLPSEVRMAMHLLLAHIYTVYRFLYPIPLAKDKHES